MMTPASRCRARRPGANMTKIGLILVALGGLMLTACGQLLSIRDDGCRITAVGVSAKRDEKGNQVNVYDFKFVDESACEGAHVNGSYNMGTLEAQEKVVNPGAQATSVWRCDADPWLNATPGCTKLEALWSGNVNPSQADITAFEQMSMPMGAIPLIQFDRDTLKGQLRNAVNRLPAPAPDSPLTDVLERNRNTDVVVAFPTPTLPPSPPVTGALVRRGAQGPNVEAIQYLLQEHGLSIAVDGDFGQQTEDAVRAFQRAKNLGVDGIVGPSTWGALWVTVRKDATNERAVQAAQTLLNWHGQNVVVDGDFGDQTDSAVRAFQRSRGLTADGIIGNRTWTALVNAP